MLIEILWPEEWHLRVDSISVIDDKLILAAHGTQQSALCPECGQLSERRNGHYCRNPADLPCAGYAVHFCLSVPRFFCDNRECPRRTFAATFPEILRRYARRTNRLTSQQEHIGFTVSGEVGSRLLQLLGMFTSPDTLLRLVRQAPEQPVTTPRVLGVDDWAKRKGQTYGTILVDLETHKVVDLLDCRSTESFAQRLKEHPGVEVIARDRGADYIDGATKGAQDAIQVADRFHLFQNIVEALKRMLEKQPKVLRAATHAVTLEMQEVANLQVGEPEEDRRERKPTERELRFAEVKSLQAEGWKRRAVARYLNMSRRTVGKYFELNECPEWPSRPQYTSRVAPHMAYLRQRWQEGCQSITKLHEELGHRGFDGHYSSVYRAVAAMLERGELSKDNAPPLVSVTRLSPTAASWLLIHPDERLDDEQLRLRDKLCAVSADIARARQLALSFCKLLRERLAEELDDWLLRAEQSGIKSLMSTPS